MKKENFIIPTELVKAIKNNELIIFVGAGLSYDLVNRNNEKLKGWNNLVIKILNHLKDEGFNVDFLLGLNGHCEPIEILNLIEKGDKFKDTIATYIKDFLDLDKNKNDFSLHQNIFKLAKKIITTNYDTAFECCCDDLDKNVAYKGKNFELTQFKKNNNSSLLFKLHGCFKDIDSMVLYPSNYTELYKKPSNRDAEHSITALKNIILNKTLLFIGAGMGDFQINNIFSEVKKLQGDYNQKHFIITRDSLDSQLDFLTPIKINGFAEINDIVDKLLAEKEFYKNQKSPETLLLEEQLLETTNKLNNSKEIVLKKDKKLDYYKALCKEESLKYFKKGINFHLEGAFDKACRKYKKATKLNPKEAVFFNNWGIVLKKLSKLNNDKKLHQESFDKYKRATALSPKYATAFYNWGNAISELAKLNKDKKLYKESFDKYEEATKLNPKDVATFINWGIALKELAKLNNDVKLYQESFDKYKEAARLNPKYALAFNNWGIAITELAKLNNDVKLYQESFKKYKEATILNPKYADAFYNWGDTMLSLAKLKKDDAILKSSIPKFERAVELGGESYNFSCTYALLKNKKEALNYLERSLKNNEIKSNFVKDDEDWQHYKKDKDFLTLLKKYKTK